MIIIIAATTLFMGLVVLLVSHKLQDKHVKRRMITVTVPDHAKCEELVSYIDPVTLKVFARSFRTMPHCRVTK